MVGIGKRPQPGQTRVVHARTSAGTLPGNQRRPNQKATFTSRISTGTSTSGPMTAAKATGEASPKAAMATAMASSKLLPAAVNATAVRSEEHTSELQSLMRISYAVFCLTNKNYIHTTDWNMLLLSHYYHTDSSFLYILIVCI